MYIDRDLANRALGAIGEAAIEEDDYTSRSFLLIKKHYLNTMLELLERVKWTSGIKRIALQKAEIENLTDYSTAYLLPIDVSKIIGLKDKSYYIVEGNILYTDGEGILIYITNGKITDEKLQEKKQKAIDSGVEFTEEFGLYDPPKYEEHFYNAFELRLASKLALELSGKAELHQMLVQEALIAEEVAYRNTKKNSAGKQKGKDWW